MTTTSATAAPAANLDDTASRVTIVDKANPTAFSSSDLAPPRSGIFATALDPKTQMPAQTLTPDTLVTITMPSGQKMEGVSIEAAMRAGLITRTPDGEYHEVSPEALQSQEQQEADPDKDPVRLDDAKAEEYVGAMYDLCRQIGEDPQQALVVEFLSNPTEMPKVLGRIAQQTGQPVQAVEAAYAYAFGAFYKQAHAYVQGFGLNSEEFFEWANGNRRQQLIGAHLRHFAGRLDGYKQLAEGFAAAKGLKLRQRGSNGNRDGVTVIGSRQDPGQGLVVIARGPSGSQFEMSAATARRNGYIR